jgi:hypothetical protein
MTTKDLIMEFGQGILTKDQKDFILRTGEIPKREVFEKLT